MTDEPLRQRAIALYDRFTHEHGDRRRFLKELTAVAGSAAAAQTLLLGIAADPAAAAISDPSDPKLRIATETVTGYQLYAATPKVARGTVIVVHENRGLTDHIRDVARRVALSGFRAVAPDFLSKGGGTPADQDKARTMIGALDLQATVADAHALTRALAKRRGANGRIAVIGFCWGGAFVNRLAVEAGTDLRAGVAYYGVAPSPALAPRVKAALMLHYAGQDARVNASAPAWTEALKAAKADVTEHYYAGVNHAFNNDSSAERYDKAAADLAWSRTIAFLRKHVS